MHDAHLPELLFATKSPLVTISWTRSLFITFVSATFAAGCISSGSLADDPEDTTSTGEIRATETRATETRATETRVVVARATETRVVVARATETRVASANRSQASTRTPSIRA